MQQYSPLTLISTFALLLILPAMIFLLQNKQNTQSRASQSTTIAFSPTTKQVGVHDTFTLDIWVNPGAGVNAKTISTLTLHITYEPNLLEVIDPTHCITLISSFTTAGAKTTCTNGNIITTIVITDITNLLSTSTKIGSITLRAIAPKTTYVLFGNQTKAGPVQSPQENVAGDLIPAKITIR